MTLTLIKQLREKTGAGVVDCQKALQESGGNFDKAVEILRRKGERVAFAKQVRVMKEGVVDAYIHSNKKIGAMVELTCETDFVARNQEFRQLAHDLAMQVAATNPQWLKPGDVPNEILEKEKKIYQEEIPARGGKDKPAAIKEKIIEGKLNKFYSEVCLIKQPFIKDDKITVEQLIVGKVAKLGENIQIKNFVRFSLT